MDDWKIPMPTEDEKKRAITGIVDAALPRRVSFARELWAILEQVGPRGLLFGGGDCLALSLLIWALCLLPALALASSTGSLAPALFLFSPLLYATLSLLTGWKNLQTGLWEWTWTFRISARMVTALRKTGRCGCLRGESCPWAGCCPCPWPVCFSMASCPCSASGCGGWPAWLARRPAGSCWV